MKRAVQKIQGISVNLYHVVFMLSVCQLSAKGSHLSALSYHKCIYLFGQRCAQIDFDFAGQIFTQVDFSGLMFVPIDFE